MTLDARRLVMAAALLLLASGSWWLTRAVMVPERPLEGRQAHDPDYTIENFRATVMDERGQRRYVLSAVRLAHYGRDDGSELEQPYLVQYREGTAPVHTRADRGWMPGDGSEIQLVGNAVSSRGRDPRAGEVEVRADKMKIRLDK